jgi:hypothetical protein
MNILVFQYGYSEKGCYKRTLLRASQNLQLRTNLMKAYPEKSTTIEYSPNIPNFHSTDLL